LLKLHAATILAFFVGGVVGVLAYREAGSGALVLAGGFLGVVAWRGMSGRSGHEGKALR
jgi:hypothetical protein